MIVACSLFIATLGQASGVDRLPIEVFDRARVRDFATSEFEWTLSWVGGRDDGLVERHMTRRAGDDLWESNLGDENRYHPTMYRSIPHAAGPDDDRTESEWPAESTAGTQNSLSHAGRIWYIPRAEHSITARVTEPTDANSHAPFDFSFAGFAPTWNGVDNNNPLRLHGKLLEGLEEAEVSEVLQDGLRKITAKYNNKRLVWYLDSTKGDQPVRAEFLQDDDLQSSSETEYQLIGDRWVPDSISFYTGYDNSPSQIISVERATFDDPSHMQEITPSDIGALFGTQFQSKDGRFCWDGSSLIPEDDYFELIFLYGMRPDPRILERLAKSVDRTVEQYLGIMERTSDSVRRAYFAEHGKRPWLDVGAVLKPGEKDEWDVYVEEFIAKHKLKGDALKRAKDILVRSKKLRDARMRKNAPKIKEAKREGDDKKVAHYEGITKRIFDEVLVRSLKRLIPKTTTKPKTEKVVDPESP
jgi:hypothetical protein